MFAEVIKPKPANGHSEGLKYDYARREISVSQLTRLICLAFAIMDENLGTIVPLSPKTYMKPS